MTPLQRPKLVILCGGQGRRLHRWTANLPKPLVPLHGKPILQHIMEFYLAKQFREVILCAGFKSELIREFVQARHFPARVEISDAGEGASMLQRLHAVREQIGERAMVTYGDTFMDLDPDQMVETHLRQGTALTLTIADIRSPFGIVTTDAADRVQAFEEKPVLPYFVGHLMLERRVLDELEPDELALPDGEGVVALFHRLIAEQQVGVYRHTGLQITFNTPLERDKAEEDMIKFFTQREEEHAVLQGPAGAGHGR